MRKIEIVSLVFVVVAVGVLMIALQMDDASARKWLFMLSVAMLILAMDPKLSLIKKKKVKEVEAPEEDGPGHIYLSSAVSVESVDRKWLDGRDIFLRFLDIESEDDYFIHYVNDKADEVFVGGLYYLESQDFDEVFEGYETLDGLLAAKENEEIEDLSLISSDDFEKIKHLYQDWQITYGQKKGQDQPEPVNRVGKMIAYLLALFAVAGICMAIYTVLFATST